MKKLIPGLILALICTNASAQTVPDGFDSIGGLIVVGVRAQACGLRDAQWTSDLMADAGSGLDVLFRGDYPNGVPPADATAISTYLLQRVPIGMLSNEGTCAQLKASELLTAGDQAVQHYRETH